MLEHNSVGKLTPYIVSKVWGGEKLRKLKNLKSGPQGPIGETWEVSNLPNQNSRIDGVPIGDFIGDPYLPYIVKFIDTRENLSIQVHPDDEYAKRVENSLGKTECWVILDARPGAGIYLGLKKGVTKEEFRKALEEKKDLSNYLHFHPVRKGDFFWVPAGAAHSIGAGVFLLEVQQSSGITYRVWDWNRVGMDGNPRELHIQKSLDVMRFDEEFNSFPNFHIKKSLFEGPGIFPLAQHPQFKVTLLHLLKGDEELLVKRKDRAGTLIVLEGEVEIVRGDNSLKLGSFNSSLVFGPGEAPLVRSGELSLFIWVS